MEITLLQIYALKQNALSGSIQPVSKWGWCGESECAAAASWSLGTQEFWGVFCLWGVEGAELQNHWWELRGGCEPSQNLVSPFSSTLVTGVSTHVWHGWWWSLSAPKEKQGYIWGCRRLGGTRGTGQLLQSDLPNAAASGTNTCPQCLSAPSTVSLATGNSWSWQMLWLVC